MATLFQVGVGSGGMAVLDALCRAPEIDRVILVDPDTYESANVHRHYFGHDAVGRTKVDLACEWVKRFRPELNLVPLPVNLLDSDWSTQIETSVAECNIGVCAADNESAKYHFDSLMRRHRKPWTLGEVLSGGIGGWVHLFRPDGPCYGCVASHLQRTPVTPASPAPDYAAPGGPIETRVPASKSAIQTIASLHAGLTLELLNESAPDWTSLLYPLTKVPGIFAEAHKPFRMRIARLADCLMCRTSDVVPSGEDLDVALDQALARLGHE